MHNPFESHFKQTAHGQAQDRRSSSKDYGLKKFLRGLQAAEAKFKGNTRAQ